MTANAIRCDAVAVTMDRAAWFHGALEIARSEWPDFAVDDDAFRAHLDAKIAKLPAGATFATLRVTDLYLAFACLNQDEAAFVAFEDRYFPKLASALTRMRLSAATIDDLKAHVRELAFFGMNGAAPLVGDYSGRGDLASWLRSIVVRLAFKSKKKHAREVDAEPALANVIDDANPELLYLRRVNAAAFEEALAKALHDLEPRERNLLRQHYLDGLTLEALAALHHVHRATVARQLATAREKILEEVKRALVTRMSPSELESFLRSTRRGLDLRISTHLRVTR